MKDPYVYQDVPVLINKLNIKDADRLAKAEADITAIKLLSIDRLNQNQALDMKYIKELHKHIFEDIYPFAGQLRTVPVIKAERVLGGDTVRYSAPSEIEKTVEKTILSMDRTDWRVLSLEERSLEYTKAIAALWQAHPFREGNTRTTMTFAAHYAERNDFPIDRQLFSENAGYVRNALVKASDGIYSDYQYLNRIMKDAMELGEESFIIEKIKAAGFTPAKILVDGMKQINQEFHKLHTVKELKHYMQHTDSLDKEKADLVKTVAQNFIDQERQTKRVHDIMRGLER